MKEVEQTFSITAFGTRRLHRFLLVAGLGATIAIPLMLGGGQTLSAASQITPGGYASLLGLVLAAWLARAAKLHLLLHRLKRPTAFVHSLGISLATDLAFAATPAGVGGYLANIYYLRRAGTSASGAVTITAIDQGLDLVFFAAAVPIAALALAGSGLSPVVTVAAATGAALTAAVVPTLWFARKRIRSWLSDPNSLSERWPRIRAMQHALRKFLVHLSADLSLVVAAPPMFLVWMLGLTAVQWLARYGVLWLTLILLGHVVSFAVAFLSQVVVLHAALWTGVPAGGGSAEIGLTAMFAYWIPPAKMAAVLLVWRAATLYTSLIAGSVAMVLLAKRARPPAADIRTVRDIATTDADAPPAAFLGTANKSH